VARVYVGVRSFLRSVGDGGGVGAQGVGSENW